MLIRRLARVRPLSHLHHAAIPLTLRPQRRWASQEEIDDPNMNGGYINPPPISRQKRDPYGSWWDKQERRNYGEHVHEDNDIMGVFAPENYDFYTSAQIAVGWACVAAFFGSMWGIIYLYYPDKVAVDRGFEGGLDRELGGRATMIAREEDGID